MTDRPTPGDFARTSGYDPAKWGTQNTVKYRAGEILARYPPTPDGLQQAINDPDFKAKFPNAQLVGADTIDFGGVLSDFESGVPVTQVDVGRSFKGDPSQQAWVWQDLVNTGAPQRQPTMPMSSLTKPPAGPTPSPGSVLTPPPMPDRNTTMPVPETMPMAEFAANPSGTAAFQLPDRMPMSDLVRKRQSRIGVMA